MAKADGKQWGGSRPGRQHRVNRDKVEVVLRMAAQGKSVAATSRVVGLSRQWVYELIRREGDILAGLPAQNKHNSSMLRVRHIVPCQRA